MSYTAHQHVSRPAMKIAILVKLQVFSRYFVSALKQDPATLTVL